MDFVDAVELRHKSRVVLLLSLQDNSGGHGPNGSLERISQCPARHRGGPTRLCDSATIVRRPCLSVPAGRCWRREEMRVPPTDTSKPFHSSTVAAVSDTVSNET